MDFCYGQYAAMKGETCMLISKAICVIVQFVVKGNVVVGCGIGLAVILTIAWMGIGGVG
jgi:hypothetical protein